MLDDDDLAELRDEYRDALSRAAASRDTDEPDEVLRAWRLTAELLRRTDAVDRLERSAEPTREVSL